MRKSTGLPNDERQKRIGLRLRLARQAAGLSQTKLGEGLGVSFQQIQKYERGANRLSVEALERSCAILGVSTASLFIDGPVELAMSTLREEDGSDPALTGEIVEVATAFAKIATPALRRRVLDLVLSLSRGEEKA